MVGWGYVDAFSVLANGMHGGGREVPGSSECLFWASGRRDPEGVVRGGESIHENVLGGCVVNVNDGTRGAVGHCEFRDCGRGRLGDVWNSAGMARPTGREKEGRRVWRDDASRFDLVLALERTRKTDSQQQRQGRWIYVK